MFSLLTHYAWLTAQAIILCALLFPAVLYTVYCLKKATRKQPSQTEESVEEKDYAIIVSVTNETKNLTSLFQALSQLNYTNYLVYVVMNQSKNCRVSFASDKTIVLQPARPFSNTARTHRYAIENFRRPHTHVVVLNSNSFPDAEYLNELNVFFNQGYQAVQGFFTRKKQKTVVDFIHTVAHSCNCFFYGNVSFTLGSSARLNAAGCAFTISIYKQCLKSANTGLESLSKVLQYTIVSKGYTIAFAPKAIVYNENKMQLQSLVKQHASGINGWFRRFANHISFCLKSINMLSINRFLFGFLLLQPPMLTTFLAGVLCLVMNVWMNPAAAVFWMICLSVFSSYFVIAAIHLRAGHRIRKLLAGASQPASYAISGLYNEVHEEMYNIAN